MPIDPTSLQQLIHDQWTPLLYWVGRHRSWAEDVVQEAFVKLAATEPVPDNPIAWLYRALRNGAINACKSDASRSAREHGARKPFDGKGKSSEIECIDISDLLDRMTTEQHEIVVARIWGDLSFDEIAVTTNQNKSAVWRSFQEALETLRRYYDIHKIDKNYEQLR